MAIKAKIYKPTKNAMQSGRAQGTQWVLEYDIETPRRPEPIMGWTSAEDTLNQVKMRFASREAAIAFAETHGFEFTVDAPRQRRVAPRSYLDNFKFRPYEEEAN